MLREFWGSFLTNPKLNGWGFIVGVLGIALAVYTDWSNKSEPMLTARVSTKMAIVVSDEPIQDLKVYAGDRLVKGPITATQIAIWNAGKRPIRGGTSEDVLEPIVISLKNNAPIISARIRKVTREVTRIQLDESRLAVGEIGVNFRVLEHGDGAVLQVIYLGDDKVSFVGRGALLGQGPFEVPPPTRTLSGRPVEPPPFGVRVFMLLACPIIFGSLALGVASFLMGKVRAIHQLAKSGTATFLDFRKPVGLAIVCIVLLVFLVVFSVLVMAAFWPQLQPPFPFE